MDRLGTTGQGGNGPQTCEYLGYTRELESWYNFFGTSTLAITPKTIIDGKDAILFS